MTANEQLIAWLNNAYSMEKALIPVLENHAKDAENYPNQLTMPGSFTSHERITISAC